MKNFTHRLALGIVTAAFFAMPIAVHADGETGNQTGQSQDSNVQNGNGSTGQNDVASNQSDERSAVASGQSDDGDKSQHTDD